MMRRRERIMMGNEERMNVKARDPEIYNEDSKLFQSLGEL